MIQSPSTKKVRQYLIGTSFYIKEQSNSFLKDSLVTISYKGDTNIKQSLIMFNGIDFTVENLKDKIDEALISSEGMMSYHKEEYKELNQVLTPLWRELKITEVLDN